MKFKNYLIENVFDDINKKEANKILQLIKKDCQPYINILKKLSFKYYLLSGRQLGYGSLNFDKKKIRTDRKPKDTPIEIHEWIDDWFYKKFGIKARSSTLFCTSDKSFAISYGKIYYIFPIGDFEFIWNTKKQDLYNRAYMDRGIDKYIDYFMTDYAPYYVKGHKKEALKLRNEIMLYCKEYYILNSKNSINHMVINALETGNEI
jgi:hypothetical protein